MVIKHPRHEKAQSGVKASKACLMSEAKARTKEKPQELATKNMQALLEETSGTEAETTANDFKIEYKAAAGDSLSRVQQKLVTREMQTKGQGELENERTQIECVLKTDIRDDATRQQDNTVNLFGSRASGNQESD